MRIGARFLAAAAVLAATAYAAAGSRAWADGAVAMGTTGNVVRDGIAFGMTVDEPKDQAAESAVKRCRTFQARAAAERCQVVATFARQCFAVAYDPKPGTPGHGWGVGPDQLAANQRAIAMCEETAGPARKGYCQVESGGCDTTGQKGASSQPSQQGGAGADQTLVRPGNTGLDPLRAPPGNPPARRQEQEGSSWLGTRSPVFLVGIMLTVGAAYALGQLARGKLKGGLSERQVVVGGVLAVASGAVVKLLELAGLEEGLIVSAVGVFALAAAIFA
jgi:uncharacterized protein DUF4189